MPTHGHIDVQICDWANAADRDAMLALRENVFVLEQHVPREMETDDDDPCSVHVLARTPDGAPVGTGRLTPDGQIGRMAVPRDLRGRGIGTRLLHALLEQAGTHGLARVSMHAQRQAVAFYLRHGFAADGPEFDEAGIAHVVMHRSLGDATRPSPPPSSQALELHAATREELIAITQTLLSGARHSMCVLVRELHPMLLDDTACLVELRRLAISGRGASIRIITQDLTRAVHEHTRLLGLAQRLSSVIELRRPTEQPALDYPSAFMCVDTQGYLFRPLGDEMATQGSTWSPGRHVRLMQIFEDTWTRSEPWPELRTLGI